MEKKPEMIDWHGMKLVRISDVGEEFAEWLYGQTLPWVIEREDSTDWAYWGDYNRFINNRDIID